MAVKNIKRDTETVRKAMRDMYGNEKSKLLIEEVKRSSGYRPPERFADAIILNLYPSQGCEIEGIEIKQSRQDLVRELKHPEKSEEIKQFCDYWWLFVSDENLISGLEIPDDWGIKVLNRFGSLELLRGATKLTPKPIDRYFLMSLIRNCKNKIIDDLMGSLDSFKQ